MNAWVVESPVYRQDGVHAGTARVYVATEARAAEIAALKSDRTYRAIAIEEMPAIARENLLR